MDESPYVYGYLCDLIEGNHPQILGPNNGNIPRIIAIFAEAFSVEALPATHEVHKRMVNITRQVQVCGIFSNFLKRAGRPSGSQKTKWPRLGNPPVLLSASE